MDVVQKIEIDKGAGKIAFVEKINERMSNHIFHKGYIGDFPSVGNYFEYDSFGEGTYIVYDKDFIDNQIKKNTEVQDDYCR